MPSTVVFERRLGRRIVIAGLISGLALGALGWFVDRAVVSQERGAVTAMLDTVLTATVRSVTGWLDDRRAYITLMGTARRVREAVAAALKNPAEAEHLREVLRSFAVPFDLKHGALVDARGIVVLDIDDDGSTGKALPASAQPYVARAWKGEACISPPIEVELGATERPDMIALTPILDAAGRPLTVLMLTIDPKMFSAKLDQTHPGLSGEALAFDVEGRMLSESRFLDEIVAAGVLPAGTRSTILTLDLRNPGVDLRTGKRSDVPIKAQPLTRIVASAIAGASGTDVSGFRDYRGVRSVAAWTWVAAYGFGLEVKMDYTEAFATVRMLRAVFWGLMALLVTAVLTLLAWSSLGARQQRRLAQAEAKAEKLGQYQLSRKLGEGGMGEVYLAHHALLRRPTAVKLIRATSADDDRVRFEREVQLGCRLTHPNTIAIYDFGHTVDGRFYYAMEYLDGMDLAKVVSKHGRLPCGRVVHLLAQVCASLAEAHDLRLVHRDVKPENIMVCLRGGVPDLVKVLDFGLVKSLDAASPRLTVSTTVCGTPAFIAPEYVQGREIDGRADLYAVAAVAYFLLTGEVPFERASIVDTLLAHVNETPRPIAGFRDDVPSDLEAVVLRGLAKIPEARFENAREMRDALLACACVGDWPEAAARAWWAAHGEIGATRDAPAEARPLPVVAAISDPHRG